MLGDSGSEEVGAVDVDIPELAHAVDGVVDGLEVLGEAGAGDQVVDLAVLHENVVDAALHRLRVGDIRVVRRHLRHSHGARVLSPEYIYQLDGLLLSLFLCKPEKARLACKSGRQEISGVVFAFDGVLILIGHL